MVNDEKVSADAKKADSRKMKMIGLGSVFQRKLGWGGVQAYFTSSILTRGMGMSRSCLGGTHISHRPVYMCAA